MVFAVLWLGTGRLKRSSGREEESMISYVEALLEVFERYMELHVKMRWCAIEHVKVLTLEKNKQLETRYQT